MMFAAGTPVAFSMPSRTSFTISSQAPMVSIVTIAAFVSPSSMSSTPARNGSRTAVTVRT